MAHKMLVVVESPAKARTISHLLGTDYIVEATAGHIAEPAIGRGSADPATSGIPRYDLLPGKAAVLRRIRSLAARCDIVLLATDSDREGEEIAWHLFRELQASGHEAYRIHCQQLDAAGIADAIANKQGIDERLVWAGLARKEVDRLLTAALSRILRKNLGRRYGGALSLGRVQAAALGYLLEYEEGRRPVESNRELRATFTLENSDSVFGLEARYAGDTVETIGNEKAVPPSAAAEEQRAVRLRKLQNWQVVRHRRSREKHSPPHCYTTLAIIAEADRRLALSPRETMRYLRTLFEGVALGGFGRVGLISYYRSNSTALCPEAVAAGREYVGGAAGNTQSDGLPRLESAKIHEAIRPTVPLVEPAEVRPFTDAKCAALYAMIFQRFITVCADDGYSEKHSLEIVSGTHRFVADCSREYLALSTATDGSKDATGSACRLLNIEARCSAAGGGRLSEADCVVALGQAGVGRPASYSGIVNGLLARKLVRLRESALSLSPKGRAVAQLIRQAMPECASAQFSRELERQTTMVAEGKAEYCAVVDAYRTALRQCEQRPIIPAADPDNTENETAETCPECSAPMRIKEIRSGRFLACSRNPQCKGSRPVGIGMRCPQCNTGEIVERRSGKYQRLLYTCSLTPECTFASTEKPIPVACPQCANDFIVSRWRRTEGEFFQCPACDARVSAHALADSNRSTALADMFI